MVEVTIIEILRTLALTGFQASEKNLSAQLSDRAKFHVISCHFRPAKTRKADSGFTEISHFLVEMTGIEPVSESIFTGISPSAAHDLLFRLFCRP